MRQKTFFDEAEPVAVAPIARRSDHWTSQTAAAEAEQELPRYQAELLTVLGGLTGAVTAREAAKETAKRFSGMEDTYRKRMLDLVKRGCVEVAGERPCMLTGSIAMTFKVSVNK
jgi:hypothetical protein